MLRSDNSLRGDFIHNKDDKSYRHAYADESLNISIATQIKVLREQRGMRQEDLAQEASMHQTMISRYENVNYSSWSINTLKKLAEALDVWLDVRFRSFGDLVATTDRFNRESLEVPAFRDDPFFQEEVGNIQMDANLSNALKGADKKGEDRKKVVSIAEGWREGPAEGRSPMDAIMGERQKPFGGFNEALSGHAS